MTSASQNNVQKCPKDVP